jgi:uncharacterized membrane protein YeiB
MNNISTRKSRNEFPARTGRGVVPVVLIMAAIVILILYGAVRGVIWFFTNHPTTAALIYSFAVILIAIALFGFVRFLLTREDKNKEEL